MKAIIAGAAILMGIAGAAGEACAQKSQGGRPTVDIRVCNNSGHGATVAVSFVQPGETRFINRGWYDVADGRCEMLVTTDNQNFYMYAEATDNSGLFWGGDFSLCVQYPGPYTFYSASGNNECTVGQELRKFRPLLAPEPGAYTWNLNR
jgi:uncharacterized membrane protein